MPTWSEVLPTVISAAVWIVVKRIDSAQRKRARVLVELQFRLARIEAKLGLDPWPPDKE